jgi:hypothetical protein
MAPGRDQCPRAEKRAERKLPELTLDVFGDPVEFQ